MQNTNAINSPTVELTLTRFEKPLEVDLERFFEFSFNLAEDLLDMEARFQRPQLSRNKRGKILEKASRSV